LFVPTVMSSGQANASITEDATGALDCQHEAPIDVGALTAKGPTAMVAPEVDAGHYIAHTLRGKGFDAGEDGTGRGTPLVTVPMINMQGSKGNAVAQEDGPSFTLNAMHGHDVHAVAVPVAHAFDARQSDVLQYGDRTGPLDTDGHSVAVAVAFDTTQITSPSNYSRPQPGDPCHPLAAGAHPPAVAVAPTLTAANDPSRSPQSSEVQQQVAAVHATTMQVRRLTPRECERLQGFPDGYTAIPWRGRPASECPDGPRYRALGNSMAVPVMRYLGERIVAVESER
jgi:DNA (cytosine-5)-methyltransferase 1